jgi:hypothetical protein
VTAQDVQDPPVWDGPPTTGHCPICGEPLTTGGRCLACVAVAQASRAVMAGKRAKAVR